MLSKNTLKFIKSLHQKKFRKQERSFFVEGSKNVTELLQSDFEITHLLFTPSFGSAHMDLIKKYSGDLVEVSEQVLESLGAFKSNSSALAVAKIRQEESFSVESGELVLVLDDVRDPGNLGTIIRIADWYGITKIVLSPQTADFYNPKVLQASMGSFTRIHFFYQPLVDFLANTADMPIYGAFLEGENIHHTQLTSDGIIVMGNESQGISSEVARCIPHKITIPSFGYAESLNVAVATAIICDNFRRGQS
jgi:TrmH family RNA methyltransferase